jgi:hypothetical protein
MEPGAGPDNDLRNCLSMLSFFTALASARAASFSRLIAGVLLFVLLKKQTYFLQLRHMSSTFAAQQYFNHIQLDLINPAVLKLTVDLLCMAESRVKAKA